MNETPLPTGWARTRLGDVCMPVSSAEPARDSPSKTFVYVDISAIDRASRTISEPKRLIGRDAPSRARQLTAAGDVLYSTVRPNLRTFANVPDELDAAIASTGFCVLRASDAVRPGYLFWVMSDPSLQDRITAKARGVSYPAVRDDDIFSEEVVVPPVAEQDRILAVLTEEQARCYRAKDALHEASELLPLLRARALERLNTSAWPIVRIDGVGEVFVGTTPSRRRPELWGGGIPWVSSGEISFCRISTTRETISGAALGTRARRLHPPGTVMLAMIGEGKTRGQAALLEVEAAHNQNSAAIRVDKTKMLPEFLFLVLMRQYERNRRIGRGGQQPALNKGLIEGIEVPCPPLPEQTRVVDELTRTLAVLDEQATSLEGYTQKVEAVSVALLRDALAGALTVRADGDEAAELTIARASRARPEPTKRRRRARASA